MLLNPALALATSSFVCINTKWQVKQGRLLAAFYEVTFWMFTLKIAGKVRSYRCWFLDFLFLRYDNLVCNQFLTNICKMKTILDLNIFDGLNTTLKLTIITNFKLFLSFKPMTNRSCWQVIVRGLVFIGGKDGMHLSRWSIKLSVRILIYP